MACLPLTGLVKPKRVVVFGDGLLGRELTPALSSGHPWSRIQRFSHSQCDIRNFSEVFETLHRPNDDHDLVVINAAAYTDVDKAEQEPKEAFAVNALGGRNVAIAAQACGATLVHVSTNAVFDAKDGEFDETDAPKAASAYGYSKLVGEEFVRSVYAQQPIRTDVTRAHYIVRTSFLYGQHGKNFGSKLFGRLRAGEKVEADPWRLVTPTWAGSVAVVIREMLERQVPSGIYHAVSAGPLSWYRFAQEAAFAMGDRTFGVNQTEAVGFEPRAGLAPRPPSSIMISRKLQMFDIHVPTVQEGLQAAIKAGI